MRIPRIRLGPGTVVAAAFIGPGTLTTATVAGVSYGNTLLWALVFSTLATIVLQEMAARLGVIGGVGLGEAIRQRFERKLVRYASAALVIGAIVLGNAAYQTGNLLGGALGIAQLVGGSRSVWGSLLGLAAFVLLWSGRYRWIERVLVAMVAIMGAVFFATAIAVRADPASLARGLVPTGFA
ncbi:MAG: Nramp family divalent metal transporter, partial [Gemmatimonadota bacterium]